MALWLILTVMTSAAAVWLMVPLIRHAGRPHDETGSDIAVYRDQLQEVERDLKDGRIDAAQAETARIEIRRRILAAGAPRPAAGPSLSGRERSFVIIGATAVVALGSAILYAAIGSPGLATGLAARRSFPSTLMFADDARTGARAGTATQRGALPPQHPALDGPTEGSGGPAFDGGGEGEPGLPTVEEMTRRLAARLARNPSDVDGWRTLGWSYLNLGRFDDAAAAYAKAIERNPGNIEFMGGRIEALVGAANGVVTPQARAAIGEVLKRDPKDVRARYFAGLSSEQDGDKPAAVAMWTDVLTDMGSGARVDPLALDLRSRVRDLRRDMGLDPGPDPADIGPAPAARPRSSRAQAEPPASPAAGNGPTTQDMQAAAAMPPADRATMIRGMVEGLASRLERAPRDADGWIKLIRARVVLGEGDLAREALARGLAAFADDARERDRIAGTARELGVDP
jgi:cytochrome c-type biogenesis protein CcmH